MIDHIAYCYRKFFHTTIHVHINYSAAILLVILMPSGCGSWCAWSVHHHPGCVADHATAVSQSTERVSEHPTGPEPSRPARGAQGDHWLAVHSYTVH